MLKTKRNKKRANQCEHCDGTGTIKDLEHPGNIKEKNKTLKHLKSEYTRLTNGRSGSIKLPYGTLSYHVYWGESSEAEISIINYHLPKPIRSMTVDRLEKFEQFDLISDLIGIVEDYQEDIKNFEYEVKQSEVNFGVDSYTEIYGNSYKSNSKENRTWSDL